MEVCYDGVWGTVCNRGWDTTDARIVCKQLGFSSIGKTFRCLSVISLHRAKSEISYVFYVHDRCRIGLIHMSATNPIEEI